MKWRWTLVFVVALIILAKFTYDDLASPFKSGEVAPNFSTTDINGSPVSLSDLSGSFVLVHFWATWCGECVKELPHLERFAAGSPEIKVLAINEDENGVAAVTTFFGSDKPAFKVLIDHNGNIADLYKSFKIPDSYLIGKDGRILKHLRGSIEWDEEKATKMVKKILSESPKNIQ